VKIVTCFKLVPDEQDLSVRPDGSLDLAAADWKIGSFDLNAVETAVTLADEADEVIALTVGDAHVEQTKLQKAVLSRGSAALVAVVTEAPPVADALATARLLAAAIRRLGGVDLVLTGEGSGDTYAQQVGPVVGALLGWPALNAVDAVARDGAGWRVERALAQSVEVLAFAGPAVLSVTPSINSPRIPGMRDILGAGKKPVTLWPAAELDVDAEPGVAVVSVVAPDQVDRLRIVLPDDSAENIDQLAGHIERAL
jgi:electron transfer flavoprotein beta subunit